MKTLSGSCSKAPLSRISCSLGILSSPDRRSDSRREIDRAAIEDRLALLDILLLRDSSIGRVPHDLNVIEARRDDRGGYAEKSAYELDASLVRQNAHRTILLY